MKKEQFNLLFALISCLCIGTGITVLPLFENKSELDIIQECFTDTDENIVGVGDPPVVDPEAYHYWYAPENSFGINSTKTVNWSYFKQLFQDHFYKNARYKIYEYSNWQDGTQYLTLNRTWNESGFWKVDIILDVPIDLYAVNISFGCDIPVLQYIEREGYEIHLTYPANETENYTVVFNWSDIASIPNLVISKHRTDNIFYISFERLNVPAGHYEFDPTFGVTDHDYALESGMTQVIAGTKSSGPADDGTADNITFWMTDGAWTNGEEVKCALYTLDNGNVYDFVAETEERTSGGDNEQTWTFSSPPAIYSAETYGIVILSDDYIKIDGTTSGDSNRLWSANTPGYNFDNPHTFSGTFTGHYSAYCSYTEGGANTAPTIAGEIPANTSTGISVTPQLNVTVDDADDDYLNVTWLSNSSGSWVWFAKNSSIDGATLPLSIVQTNSNFTTELTKYWWSVNASDGTDWTNETYSFTTSANRTWQNLSYGYLTGGNESSYTNLSYGYLTGGNVSSFENLSYGYLLGGNITTYTNISYGYLTGGNVSSFENLTYGYLTGGNVSSYENLSYGYLTGGNTSSRGWINNSYGYLSGGNTSEADTTPPSITINFAGNLSDSGGPYWRPPGESVALAGIWSDGYYTNDSKQQEDWIYINLSVSDAGGVPNVWLQWLNGTTWTNYTYPFLNTTGGFFEFNTSGNISTAEGYDYSFNIVANDTSSNSNWVGWNKTGVENVEVRRYVQLNCTPINMSYVPLYFFEDDNTGGSTQYDRGHHDQGSYSADDQGFLLNTTPTSAVQYIFCWSYVSFWYDESASYADYIENIYYHAWYSSKDRELAGVSWFKTQQNPSSGGATGWWDSYPTNSSLEKSSIFYNNGGAQYNNNYSLDTKLVNLTAVERNFTDNDIYEFFVHFKNLSSGVSVISNRSFTSFILFNVPDNATLNATGDGDTDGDGLKDWTELYVNYTNPFLADTDNDGVTDYNETLSGSDPNNYTDTIEYTETLVWQNLSYGYLTGGNVTSYTNVSYGYLLGGNITDWINISYGFLTGGNVTTYSNLSYGYLTGGNTSSRTWINTTYGYLTGGNITTYTNTSYGYLLGGNETTFTNISYGYLTGGNITGYTNISYGYLTGGNTSIRGWINNSYGYLTGGNTSSYTNNSYGFLTGGNISSWDNISYGWLTGGNVTSNLAPTFSNEDPTNGAIIYVLLYNWSLVIQDETMFNWTLECNNSQNHSGTNDTNGTFYLNLSGLTTYTTYTIWANASDGTLSSNASYIFTVMPAPSTPSGSGGRLPLDEEEGAEPQEEDDSDLLTYSAVSLIGFMIVLFLYKRRKKKRKKL